jgi:AcrR family transcriptional regulator
MPPNPSPIPGPPGDDAEVASPATPPARARSTTKASGARKLPQPTPLTRDTRAFAQQRAHDTHRALLVAATELFAARGFDDTQTPDIARAAGVSVGTFYRYFADKRQAFLELMAQRTAMMFERVVSNLSVDLFGPAQSSEGRRAAVSRVIDVLFETTSENPALLRVFLAMSMRDPEAAQIREEFEERGRRAIELLLVEVAPSDRIADARAAAEVIHIAAQEVALVTMSCRGVTPHARADALRAALGDMLYRYVFGSDDPR